MDYPVVKLVVGFLLFPFPQSLAFPKGSHYRLRALQSGFHFRKMLGFYHHNKGNRLRAWKGPLQLMRTRQASARMLELELQSTKLKEPPNYKKRHGYCCRAHQELLRHHAVNRVLGALALTTVQHSHSRRHDTRRQAFLL